MGGACGPSRPEALTAPLCPVPAALQELPRFQELIFEDFARFILVENTYEEVVLQTVMKDILQGACRPPRLRGARAELGGGAPLPWGGWSRWPRGLSGSVSEAAKIVRFVLWGRVGSSELCGHRKWC